MMLSSMMTKGFLHENVTVDANNGTVSVDTPENPNGGVTIQGPKKDGGIHVDAVDEHEEHELPSQLEHDDDINTMSEAASEFIRTADNCYLLVENVIARIDTKCANIILAEAAGQDMSSEKEKVTSGAGKGILSSLVARLKSLLEAVGRMIDKVKKIIFDKTTNLSKMADKIAPQVQANISNGKYREYNYTGHRWKLGEMTGSNLNRVIDAVDKIIPASAMGTAGMKTKLEELNRDNWSINDFKNKIVKEVFGSSKIEDLPKEIYSKVAGEAFEVKGFSVMPPSLMMSALKNVGNGGTIKQTIRAYEDVKKAINQSIAGAEKLNNGFSGDGDFKTTLSEYVAKRVSVLQVALGIVTTVANTENRIILDMSYEFAKALNGLAKM